MMKPACSTKVSCRSSVVMTMLYGLLASLVIASPQLLDAGENNTLTEEELADGWILLLDGQTLFGWEATSRADWKVAEGVMSVEEGEPGLLCTTSEFGDYELRLDFRAPATTNSGVFLRTAVGPKDPSSDCYELNIAGVDLSPFPTGSLVGRKRGAPPLDAGKWHSYHVTARGGHFVVRLDGQAVLDYTDPVPLGRGRIGLQLNSGKVEFRNIKLKPLGLEEIFGGKDLSAWTVYPDRKSEFSVTPEGNLRVRNGNGQLETNGRWADFTLQLDCFVNGKHLNSGIFFRSIPGQFWQGYESQIHNGYRQGDRTKPVDCGTGGFYRRQDARRVVADDFQWFHKTLIASGPHMAAWINGLQVSDWTDTRPASENPRQGLRLEAGTIIIQGHDPTTDLLFRDIRIVEMPMR